MNCECITNCLTAAITLAGFAVTIYALRKSNKEKSISNVIALKAEFRAYDDIYIKLLPKSEFCTEEKNLFSTPENKCTELGRIISYLGLFEIAHKMIITSCLSKEEFKTFFLYRLDNISKNKVVMNIIVSEADSWINLLNLMKTFELDIANS
jgi:hypothetical protein